MMAAGTAAKHGKKVILYEKKDRVGRKLMITGKGRCNITTAKSIQEMIENIPVNSNFLYSAFYTFSNDQLLELFESLGLKTKVERGDRVFPVSDRARDVVDIMKKYLRKNGAKIKHDKVEDIEKEEGSYHLLMASGVRVETDSLIIATGGLSYPQTGSTGDGYRFAEKFGHNIKSLYPSLAPVEIEEDWVKEVQGLSLKNVSIRVNNQDKKKIYDGFGEMLFTHYGLTGPLILTASSHLRRIEEGEYSISLDLKPALSYEKLDDRIQRDFKKYSNKYFGNSLDDLLPSKFIPVLVELSSIDYDKTVNQITKDERRELVDIFKNIKLHIRGYRPIEEAIITSGGVDVDQVDPATMESKLRKNLYFAGEILDVDGYTGGFNLQIAFSTGYLAGLNA